MIATPAPRPSRWWRPLAAATAVLLAGSALSALPSAPAHAADDFVYPLDESKRIEPTVFEVTPTVPTKSWPLTGLGYVGPSFLSVELPAGTPFVTAGESVMYGSWVIDRTGRMRSAQDKYLYLAGEGKDPWSFPQLTVGDRAYAEYGSIAPPPAPGTYEFIYVFAVLPRDTPRTPVHASLTDYPDYRYAELGLRVNYETHPTKPGEPYGTYEWVPVGEIRDGDGGGGTKKTATSTNVTYSNLTATTANVTATVSPSAATGNVIFKNGSVIVGTGTLNNGVATVPVAGLTPNSSVTITTEYAGDDKHEASAGSVSFTTQAASDGSNSGIGVTVPPAESDDPTGLRIATKPTAVTLEGGARTEGQIWTAANDLGAVTVNDDRRNADAQGWTLNAQAGGFTGSGTAQGELIPASALTWTATATGAGKLGPSGVTLDQPRAIATGTASNERNQATTINGHLSLAVPATQSAGGYSSTLTLTLI